MNLFDFVKSQTSILDVVKEYTSLKRAGVYWKGLCPFHSEKTGSFTVSPHKGIFYCFGCHETGDVIGFTAKVENCSQLEAAKLLGERYGITIPEEMLANQQTASAPTQTYFDLYKQVALWCHKQLSLHTEALQYVQERNFTDTTIQTFTIGYYPPGQRGVHALIKHMQQHGFLAKDLLDAHIIKQGNSQLYSPFENRIIFPIQDTVGRYCAFGGRVFKKDDDRAKYYNSQEHDKFNKGSLLYGLPQAKRAIQDKQIAYLVEGYTDCLAMVQAGYTNTVATLGTACTTEHSNLLSRLAKTVYVLYDSDTAGIKAISRLAELCWNASIELLVVTLPKGADPASCIEKKEPIEPFVKKASDIYRFIIEQHSPTFLAQNFSDKVQTLHLLGNMIWRIQDPLKRNLLLQDATQALGVPAESIKPTTHKTNWEKAPVKPLQQEQLPPLEKKLLAAILNDFSLLTEELSYVITCMPSPGKEILNTLALLQKNNPNSTFDTLTAHLDPKQREFVYHVVLAYNEELSSTFSILIKQFHQKHWKSVVQKMTALLQQPYVSSEEKRKIIDNFQTLKKKFVNGGFDGTKN